jgi:small-conductance mechanosensitive channel
VNFFRFLLSTAILLLLSPFAGAQTATPIEPLPTPETTSKIRVGEPAPVVFWNRQITIFRAYIGQVSPSERSAIATARVANLPEQASEWNVVATEASSGQYSGVILTVNSQLAFAILADDVDPESGETIKAVADQATVQLRAALEARAQQRRFPLLLRAIGLSLASTILLILGLWLVMRAGSRVLARIDRSSPDAPRQLELGGFDLRPLVRSIERGLAKLTLWAAAAAMVYVWLTFVLLRFPYSQPWGQELGGYLINLFETLGSGLLHAIPGIFTVVIIFLFTRIVTRVTSGIFSQVERGDHKLSWLDRDTARATRRLVAVLIWIFALTVAYPYIPGSGTDAFKGVSVFVGLMVSLGSAGLVNQVMSGLVVIYSRALRPGEFVRVGDDMGTVTDVGMLSTKILTRKREEITIPSAVMVGTRTVNYSRHAAGAGAVVGTTITIGYDAPWRQVHAMLLQAADQTAGVRKDPAPRVWQKALSDFYVEYELVFNLDQPSERVPILSELHMHIQDAFNEQGVQIMSPHFENQPHQKVFVPKSQWFPKPAKPTDGDQSPTSTEDSDLS